jgi:hypothetical protein
MIRGPLQKFADGMIDKIEAFSFPAPGETRP